MHDNWKQAVVAAAETATVVVNRLAGRIDEVLPVRQILEGTWRDCRERLRELGKWAEG